MSDDKVVELRPKAKDAKRNEAKKGEKCPICAKMAQDSYTPFCSKRCADIDLGKWLGDGYRIPTDEVAGFDDGAGDEE